jgi:rhomboid protease GluP
MCPHCRAFITTRDRVCPYCDTPVGPRAVDLRGAEAIFGGLIPTAQFATIAIITMNIGLFLVTMLASSKVGEGEALVRYGAAYLPAVVGGQWWRLITAGFLHGGLMHIGFNMWAMMDVGRHSEEVYGPKRMVVIYILSTMGGFGLSMLRGTPLTVGASAGLCGLVGAMIAVGFRHQWSDEAARIKAFYVRWAIYILIMGLRPFFRVDNAAHIGGLASGFVVGYIAGTPRLGRPAIERVWTIAAVCSVLLTAYAYLKLVLWLNTLT